MAVASSISTRIINAVLSQKLKPGARLGEQELATLFQCSRTIVREAMVDLAARGIVIVSPRRGWYLPEVNVVMARELYDAREIIETGLLRAFARRKETLDAGTLARLRLHLAEQKAAIESEDVERRSYLLGDFHVCLAQCLGNQVLASKLRDLTVLTTLFTMRHQTPGDARLSYEEHVAVVDALASGNASAAEHCMCQHLGTWEAKVHLVREHDPLEKLRQALTSPKDLPARVSRPAVQAKAGEGNV